ncbi:RTC4 domain-containing protein [Mycena kentingensis (nom. inval.)]|nr:RTC4 domain-containing protein [Mycena kentingensis (nom. inval.)]
MPPRRQATMPAPYTVVPDPVLNLVKHCPSDKTGSTCGALMDAPRVHKGSNKPEERGYIVQSCPNKSCNHTIRLSEYQYMYQDAVVLLRRHQAATTNSYISDKDARTPLRIAAIHKRPNVVNGRMDCAEKDCNAKGAQACIDFLCKSCCGAVGRAGGLARDECRAHQTPPVIDTPTLNPAPPAAAGVPARAPVPVPDPKPKGKSKRGNKDRVEPVNRGGGLAAPIGPLWAGPPSLSTSSSIPPNAKAMRISLEGEEKKKVNFIIYHTVQFGLLGLETRRTDPRLQKGELPAKVVEVVPSYPLCKLTLIPTLMTALELTEASLVSYYLPASDDWTTTSVSTAFDVDHARNAILRLPSSLRDKWLKEDLPDLASFAATTPRPKRGPPSPSPAGSPVRKTFHADVLNLDAAQVAHRPVPAPAVVPYSFVRGAPASAPNIAAAPVPPPVVNASLPPTPTAATLSTDIIRDYSKYSAYEWSTRWQRVNELRDTPSTPKTSLFSAFDQVFGRRYVRQTVLNYNRMWDAVPEAKRDEWVAKGDIPAASLGALFQEAGVAWMRGMNAGAIEQRVRVKAEDAANAPPTAPAPAPSRAASAEPELYVPPAPVVEDPPEESLLGRCHICSQPYMWGASEKLLQIQRELALDPTAALLQQDYCRQHTAEAPILAAPELVYLKLPQTINYAELRSRVDRFADALMDFAAEAGASEFFEEAVERITSGNRFEPVHGYFGFIGYFNIAEQVKFVMQKLAKHLPAGFCDPLTFDQFVAEVAAPEALLMLVCEDLVLQVDKGGAQFVTSPHHSAARRSPLPFPTPPPLFTPEPAVPALLKTEPEEAELTLPQNPCPFCDEALPLHPSAVLDALLAPLLEISDPDPTPDFPSHRRVNLAKSQIYCQRHRFERDILPTAMACGWPQSPDVSAMLGRVLQLRPALNEIVLGPTNSALYWAARSRYAGQNSRQAASLSRQMAVADRASLGGGYYGDIGLLIVEKVVEYMFPDHIRRSQSKTDLPSYSIFLREVLVPEVIIRLVQQDSNVSAPAASSTIKESYRFGLVLHHADSADEIVEEVDRYIAARRNTTQYRLWKDSDTLFDFDTWSGLYCELAVRQQPEIIEILDSSDEE